MRKYVGLENESGNCQKGLPLYSSKKNIIQFFPRKIGLKIGFSSRWA